jgi:hypothetical protein
MRMKLLFPNSLYNNNLFSNSNEYLHKMQMMDMFFLRSA